MDTILVDIMDRFRKRNILFVFIIGAIIFAVFINQVGPTKLISLIGNVNKPLLLLVLVFNLLNLIAFTKTWQLLARPDISFFKLFKFYMIGAFISNITPSFGTGGEPVKAMLLGKETGISKAECFAGVVSQRMLNMFPFLVLSILGLVLLFFKPELRLGIWEMLALLFSLLLGIGIFVLLIYFYVRKDKLSSFVHFSIRSLAPFIGLIKRGFDQKAYLDAVEESINSFHGGLQTIHQNKNGILQAVIFSFIGWCFDILAIYTVFLSLGNASLHISVLIIAYTISMMSGWLPLFLPGGLGITDGTMALLFVYGGVPLEVAVLATLLYRLASFWFNTILGGYYLSTSFDSN
jgi:uncharacterized protein (TIRG00374 family)